MIVRALLAAAGLGLGGCTLAKDVAGVAAAAGAGGATGNPAVAIAVGVGVRAGVDELQKYFTRKRWQGEQDAIAEAAGAAPLNQPRAWEIRHTIPFGNQSGALEVVREIATPLAACREVVFSVVDEGKPTLFTTMLCRRDAGWRWAVAEPAVDRWGFLQ